MMLNKLGFEMLIKPNYISCNVAVMSITATMRYKRPNGQQGFRFEVKINLILWSKIKLYSKVIFRCQKSNQKNNLGP